MTRLGSPPPLLQILRGTWVDPDLVVGIFAASELIGEGVLVHLLTLVVLDKDDIEIAFDTLENAQERAESLAQRVNAMRGEAAHTDGEIPVDPDPEAPF